MNTLTAWNPLKELDALRSFGLPDGVDSANVAAEFKDGLLLVHLPKAERAKPQAVDIKIL